MGSNLCNDLDAMVRTVNVSRIQKRWGAFEAEEGRSVLEAAAEHLGWGEFAQPPKWPAAAPEPEMDSPTAASEPPPGNGHIARSLKEAPVPLGEGRSSATASWL